MYPIHEPDQTCFGPKKCVACKFKSLLFGERRFQRRPFPRHPFSRIPALGRGLNVHLQRGFEGIHRRIEDILICLLHPFGCRAL